MEYRKNYWFVSYTCKIGGVQHFGSEFVECRTTYFPFDRFTLKKEVELEYDADTFVVLYYHWVGEKEYEENKKLKTRKKQ